MSPYENVVSPQQSLEQKRAAFAWDRIKKVPEGNKKEYGSLVKRTPADIQVNGLGQTLAFWRAKGYKNGHPQNNKADADVLLHVSEWLLMDERHFNINNNEQYEGNKVVYWISHDATTDTYRRATSEAIAILLWLKRFAEAEFSSDS